MEDRRSLTALQYWLPLLAWVGVTYYFSTDNFSSGETSRWIEPILHWLFPGFSPAQIEFLHVVIRKTGHVSEYFVLGILAYRAIVLDATDLAAANFRSFGFGLLSAMNDEFHQSFTQYRGASVVDVAYDSFGVLLALCLILLWSRFSFLTRLSGGRVSR